MQTINIKKYDKYKDSGIAWIGEIPEHWEVCKLLKIFKNKKSPNDNNIENNVLSLSYGNIKKRNVENNMGLLPESFETYNIIEPNNIVLRLTDLQNDHKSLRCGLVKEKGIITSAYITLELKEKNQCANYFYRLLHTFDIMKGFYGMGAGVRQNLKFDGELCNLYIIKPSTNEQEQIADYLDKNCGEIDNVIEAQKNIIEKLKEYKQAVITEAVTKGLDKSIPLKESGIEWIGKIPEHWEIEKLKNIFSFGKGLNITKEDITKAGTAVINYGQIHSKENTGTSINNSLIRYVPNSYLKNNSQSLVNKGDFIFADTSEDIEGVGNCVFIDKDIQLFAGYHSIILRHKQNKFNFSRYLSYLYKTSLWRMQIRSKVNGIKVFSISQKILKNITVIVPNKLDKMMKLTDFLDKKCSEIDTAISEKEQLIEKLTEYKKSLIYECVTGKRKVE